MHNTNIIIYPSVVLFRKRDSMDTDARENKKQQERAGKRQRRIIQSSMSISLSKASQAFISATNEGPDYVCVCCNRLMYRKTVQEYELTKYSNAPKGICSA